MVNFPSTPLENLGITSYERALVFSFLAIRDRMSILDLGDKILNLAKMQLTFGQPYSICRINLVLSADPDVLFGTGVDILGAIQEIVQGTSNFSVISGPKPGFLLLDAIPVNITTLEKLCYWSALQISIRNPKYDKLTPIKIVPTFTTAIPTFLLDISLPFSYQEFAEQGLIQSLLPLSLEPPSADPLDFPIDWLGTWNSSTNYAPKQAVRYEGSSYIAKTTNTNKIPSTHPADWDLWVQGGVGEPGIQGIQGVQGTDGISFTWRGDWLGNTMYAPNDVVAHNGSAYIATGFNSGTVPPNLLLPDPWQLLAAKGAQGIQGEQGTQGIQGIQGEQGLPGADGQGIVLKGIVATAQDLPSANNEAGDLWIVSSSGDGYSWNGSTWINIGALQGPKGDKGDQGIQGIQGIQGPQGIQGETGAPGATGATGPAPTVTILTQAAYNALSPSANTFYVISG